MHTRDGPEPTRCRAGCSFRASNTSLPVVVGVGVGTAVLLPAERSRTRRCCSSCVFLAMYAVARGAAWRSPARRLAGPDCRVLRRLPAAYLRHARRPRRMWMAPWDNAVRGGDQIAQAVWALVDRRRVRAPASASATRGICRRATPIWRWRRSAKSSVSSACCDCGACMPLIAVARVPDRRCAPPATTASSSPPR